MGRNTTLRNVLLVLLLAEVRASPFTWDTVTSVTVGVLDRYHSSCVYLLYSAHQQAEQDGDKLSDAMKIKSLMKLRRITISVIFAESVVSTLREEQCRPTYVILSSNSTVLHHLGKETKTNIWMKRGRWLLFLEDKTSLQQFFDNIHIPLNCEFLVAQFPTDGHNRDREVTLTEVYHIHHAGPLQTYRLAHWSPGKGLTWSTTPFFQRRGDLQGTVVRSGIYTKQLIQDIDSCKDHTAVRFCGQIAEIWHTLQEIMNFTSKYIVPPDHSYGSQNPDGTWNGVMNLTVDKKVEVGIGRFIFTQKRMSAVNFFPPILVSTMSVYIKRLDTDESTWNYVLAPLSPQLWLTVLTSMLTLAVFLSVTWYLGEKYGDHPEVENYSLYNSWINVFASFCQQGHDNTPRTLSCRAVYLTSYLTAVIILVAYSATFISYLTVRKTVLPFTDFKGLLNDGRYKLGVFPNSAQMNHLENSPSPTLREVYEKLVLPDYETLPTNDPEGLQRTCASNTYAFLTSPIFVRQHTGDYRCSVVNIPDAFFKISASLIISKNSYYTAIFTHRLYQMKRYGILHAITEKYLPLEPIEDDMKPPTSVSIRKITPIFILYFTGILVSVVFLLFEFQVFRRNTHQHGYIN